MVQYAKEKPREQPIPTARMLLQVGLERAAPLHLDANHDRRLSKPSPPMRRAGAGLNPHRREVTRSGRALGQGP